MRNGYFQIVSISGGYGLKIFAPKDGGEPVRINEIMDYLMFRNQAYDLMALKKEVLKGEDTILPLGQGPCPADRATVFINISADSMSASIRIIAPTQTGPKMSATEILDDIKYRKIVFGIKEDVILEIAEKQLFCTDVIIAEGTPPRHGSDAEIKYYFNTDLKIQPTQNEDGSVDFFHLNTINHCNQGDVLAELIPEDVGEFGTNILGSKIKPQDVKRAVLKYGRNIAISEDKLTLTSEVDGHVTLVEDKVFVSNVLQLENVDTSTGNIDYEGSVQINGNVQSNFSVNAKGNIIVNGVVEGAYLQAGGDIIIARGMNGMGKGSLKADGNVVVKFLENTTVIAGGYINTESMVHSNVSAGGDIMVEGKRGFVTGGKICATNLVKAKVLGSPMGASTVVEVGINPTIKQKFAQNQKDIMEINKELSSIEPVILNYLQKKKQGIQFTLQQMQYLKSLLETREEKKGRLDNLTNEMKELEVLVERQAQAQVVVMGEVFPGVKIVIGDVSTIVQSNMKYCKFMKVAGDVKMLGI